MEILDEIFSSKILNENQAKDTEMEDLYCNFAKIFKATTCDEELYAYLKQIAFPTNQVCAKKLMRAGSWSCQDCEMDSTCIICNECYENSKEKHKGHRVTFKSNTHGCCDCGDPDAWKPSGFCSKHLGTFSNDNEILSFILKSFSNEIITSIQAVLIQMVKRIILIINMKKATSLLSNPNLNKFITFITNICEANQAILHIVSEVFIGNYPFETKHQCFKLTSSSAEIVKHNSQSNSNQMDTGTGKEIETHQCNCCFIQILFQTFGTSPKHEQFLYMLLHNYKLKIIMGLSLFCSFDLLIKNKCDTILDFSIQIITEEISDIILNSTDLMNYIADRLNDLVKASYETDGHFRQSLAFIPRFYYNIVYLLKPKTIPLLKQRLYFYIRIIDILVLFHNSVVLTEATSFQKDIFNEYDIRIEIYLLELFSLLMTVFDYSNAKNTDLVFDYFISIFNQKKYKQLNNNEYSFHISVIRAFSIFITYYSFWYALNNKTDIHIALSAILSQKDFNCEMIIREVFKLFGFVLSCKSRYWIYYGETSVNFNIAYINCGIFPQCDFSLIKLLCSLLQYAHMLSIENIFQFTNVSGSYEILSSLLIKSQEQMDTTNLEWSAEKNCKHILFANQVLILFTNILRIDDYMIDLLYYSYDDIMKNKVICDLHKLFDSNERINIDAYLKSKLVQIVIYNENYCLFSVITKLLNPLLQIFKSDTETLHLVNSMMDKTKRSKEGVGFSLKPEFYDMIDLSLIFQGDRVSSAERYINEFKKKEINLLQTVIACPTLNCNKVLQKEFEAAFYSIENIQWLIMFSTAQLSNSKWSNIQRFFLFQTMKLIKIIIAISKRGNEKIDSAVKLLKAKNEVIITLLDKPNVDIDDMQKEYCTYLKIDMIEFTNYTLASSVVPIGNDDSINKAKSKNDEMLEKYRKKFKEKNNQFKETISNQPPIEINKEIEESNIIKSSITEINKPQIDGSDYICVICRLEIDSQCYYKTPYGRFGIIVDDYFISNIQIVTLRKAYEKDKDLSSQVSFDKFIKRDPNLKVKKKQKRILTCNHFVHFTCYEEFLTQCIKNSDKPSFQCPFCKLYSNTCIPMLNPTIDSCYKFMEGLSLQKAFDAYGKKQLNMLEFKLEDTKGFSWQNPIHRFVEDILSVNQKHSILISDMNKNNEVLLKTYQALVDHLRGFFVFYENYSYEQISLMHTIFCSIRILIKTNYVNSAFFIERFFMLMSQKCELDTNENCNYNDDSDSSKSKFTEALFLYMILFTHDDNDSLVHILQVFLPNIFVKMFLANVVKNNECKLTSENCMINLTNVELGKYINSDQAKVSFNSYLNKLIVCKKIISNARVNNDLMDLDDISRYNSNLDALNLSHLKTNPLMSLLTLKYPSYWPKVVNPYDAINSLLSSIYNRTKDHPLIMKPVHYGLGLEYHYQFAPLPSNILELASQMNSVKCFYCKQLSCFSLLCLTCRKKMCHTSNCIIKNSKDSSIGYFSFLYHSQICGGGNTVFISIANGEFVFFSKRMIIKHKLFAYLNQFGEEPKTGDISNEYQLSQVNLEKARNMFISYSYRKSISESRLDFLGFDPDFENESDSDNANGFM